MDDRRKLERFGLSALARLLVESGDTKRRCSLTTRDVSSDGAFLYSSSPLPHGAKVRMEFDISLDAPDKMAGEKEKARVKVRGRVIRSDSNGVAIRFESRYKITALEGV